MDMCKRFFLLLRDLRDLRITRDTVRRQIELNEAIRSHLSAANEAYSRAFELRVKQAVSK